MNTIERRTARLEQQLTAHAEPWCASCGYGWKLVILRGDEPEPICPECGKGPRGPFIRVIRIVEGPDGPE